MTKPSTMLASGGLTEGHAPPVSDAWQAGGFGILLGLVITIGTVVTCLFAWPRIQHLRRQRYWIIAVIIISGYALLRIFFDPGVDAVESINPSVTGYLGGLDFPILVAWPVGALFAAGIAFVGSWLVTSADSA